jgi:hypothetical protein
VQDRHEKRCTNMSRTETAAQLETTGRLSLTGIDDQKVWVQVSDIIGISNEFDGCAPSGVMVCHGEDLDHRCDYVLDTIEDVLERVRAGAAMHTAEFGRADR